MVTHTIGHSYFPKSLDNQLKNDTLQEFIQNADDAGPKTGMGSLVCKIA